MPSVFVIMPFAEEFSDIYSRLIKPPFEEEHFTVTRADDHTKGMHSIMRDVIHGIVNADLVIADLTASNSNVFYELGIAHGLKKPTVMLAQDIEYIPSDLRAYRTVLYSLNFIDADQLKKQLGAIAIEVNRDAFTFGNPVSDFAPALVTSDFQGSKEEIIETSSSLGNEEKGIWDFATSVEQTFTKLTESANRLVEMSIDIGAKFSAHGSQINAIQQTSRPGSASRIQQIVNNASADLMSFANGLQNETPIFTESWQVLDQDIIGIFAVTNIQDEADREAVVSLKVIIEDLRKGLQEASLSLVSLRDTISPIRGISQKFDYTVKQTIKALNDLMGEFAKGDAYLTRINDLIDKYVLMYDASTSNDA